MRVCEQRLILDVSHIFFVRRVKPNIQLWKSKASAKRVRHRRRRRCHHPEI